jgi:hypothetical protein
MHGVYMQLSRSSLSPRLAQFAATHIRERAAVEACGLLDGFGARRRRVVGVVRDRMAARRRLLLLLVVVRQIVVVISEADLHGQSVSLT